MDFLSKNALFEIFNNENVIVAIFIYSILIFTDNNVKLFCYESVNMTLKLYINVKELI